MRESPGAAVRDAGGDAVAAAPRSPATRPPIPLPLPHPGVAPRPGPGVVRITTLRDGLASETDDPSRLADLLAEPGALLWIDLTEPSPAVVEHIAGLVGIHPLVAEDINEQNQRAKVELIDSLIHVVMFVLERRGRIHRSEVDLVLGHRFLLSVHDDDWDPRTVHQLKLGIPAILGRGPDYLLWALVDGIVDAYYPIFDEYGDVVDTLQDDIIADPTIDRLQRVFDLKRELIELRHVVHPTREILSRLTNRESDLIDEEHIFYFRDVYDHLIRLTDEFDNLRELVSASIEVYLSTVNNNLSAIMKRLTAVTVVLAGIGAIAGLFGMSEATAAFGSGEGLGFWAVVATTIGMAVLTVLVMRRIHWI